jgi:hypothetical protein
MYQNSFYTRYVQFACTFFEQELGSKLFNEFKWFYYLLSISRYIVSNIMTVFCM